jgi:hypothetical protein
LVNCFLSMIVHPAMQRFWTFIWTSISSISIYLTLGWKKVSSKCCLKIWRGITIWTCIIDISSIGISNKIGSTDTSSTSTYTYSTKFKPADVINFTSWYNQTHVGTNMVPIENSPSSIANIKSFSSLDILEC